MLHRLLLVIQLTTVILLTMTTRTARADLPKGTAAPFHAPRVDEPRALLCAPNVLIGAGQANHELSFYPRSGSGATSLRLSIENPIGRDATILRTAVRGSELVLLIANTSHVWRLANQQWETLDVPFVEKEQIKDALLTKTSTFVLTNRALYIEDEHAVRTRVPLGGGGGDGGNGNGNAELVSQNLDAAHLVHVNDSVWIVGRLSSSSSGEASGASGTVIWSLSSAAETASSSGAGTTLLRRSLPELSPLRIKGIWSSPTSTRMWLIGEDDPTLRALDVTTGKVTKHEPKVGALHAIDGVATISQGDLIVVAGQHLAFYAANENRFAYPEGSVTDRLPAMCLDRAGRSVYLVDDSHIKRINGNHHVFDDDDKDPRVVAARKAEPPLLKLPSGDLVPTFHSGEEIRLPSGEGRGPVVEEKPALLGDTTVVPSFRLSLGVGHFPLHQPNGTQLTFDAMFGLRFVRDKKKVTTDEAHLFFWPELGYSSGPDNYMTVAAALHYGTLIGVSGGPFVAGLLSTKFDSGVRSGFRASVLANLLSAEIAHQYVDKDPTGEHGVRAAIAVDLFGAGIIVVMIGVPSCIIASVISTLVRN